MEKEKELSSVGSLPPHVIVKSSFDSHPSGSVTPSCVPEVVSIWVIVEPLK